MEASRFTKFTAVLNFMLQKNSDSSKIHPTMQFYLSIEKSIIVDL